MINRLNHHESPEAFAKRMIGLAMNVHRGLGCGLLEALYVKALVIELEDAGIPFEIEKRYSVIYKGREIGNFHADLVVDNRLIIEVKAVEALSIAHSIQLVNYLAIAKIDLGLLLNFAQKSLEFKTKSRLFPKLSESPDLHG